MDTETQKSIAQATVGLINETIKKIKSQLL